MQKNIKNIFSSIWKTVKLIFKKIVKLIVILEDFIIKLAANVNIGKRIMINTLIIIIAIVAFISYQSTNDFSLFTLENERDILQSDLERMNRDINKELRMFYENIVSFASRRDTINVLSNMDEFIYNYDTEEFEEHETLNTIEFMLYNELSDGKFAVEFRDNNNENVFFLGDSLLPLFENNPEIVTTLERVAQSPFGTNFSFIVLSDKLEDDEDAHEGYIDIGTIANLSSSGFGGASGALIARARYDHEDFFYLTLPNPYSDIVQLYKNDELYTSNFFFGEHEGIFPAEDFDRSYKNRYLSQIDFLNEEVVNVFSDDRSLNTYITREDVELQSRTRDENGEYIYETVVEPHLVGYLVIRNIHNRPIGYITIIKSLEDMTLFLEGVQKGYLINAIIFILISIVLVSIITRSITKPLKKVITASKEIAAGDLKTVVEIKTKDQIAEVADTFNQMASKLKNVVGEIVGASDNVYNMSQDLSANTEEASAVSQEVAATSEEIATGTENQVEQTSKTKRILEVVEEQGGKVVVGSNKVSDAIEVASAKSNQGINVIKSLSETMLNIMKEVNNTGDEVKGLREQIEKINTIIDAIDYINEETSLLSLNAAIEAARAGEAGRGFAVVADEIRKLADESNDSVQEIHNIFKEINIAMQQVEKSMNNSSNMAKSSEEAVLNAEKSFEDILSSVQQVREISKEINHYVEEQKNSTKEISVAIDDVHRIAELNAEGADQSAKSSEEEAFIIEQISEATGELSNMADNLRSLVNIFKV
ncbi:methyl-accepting chemotaxis protein [Natronospora cellulosivora (SeqCode)]